MEIDLTPRSAAASRVSLSIIIMPGQANPYGTLHGGVMLRLADECGAIAALRHVGAGQITTAAMDSMIFLGPVFVGERVEVIAEVTYVGRSSLESRIEIFAEPLERADRRKIGVGYGLYVALDDNAQRHEQVPPLLSETAADHRRDEFARARQVIRLARRAEARAEARPSGSREIPSEIRRAWTESFLGGLLRIFHLGHGGRRGSGELELRYRCITVDRLAVRLLVVPTR